MGANLQNKSELTADFMFFSINEVKNGCKICTIFAKDAQ